MKRRRKREKERLQKKQAEGGADESSAPAEANLMQMAADEFSSKQIIRTDSKILNFDFEPSGRGKEFLVSFYNNSIELYHRKKQTGPPSLSLFFILSQFLLCLSISSSFKS